MVCKTPLQIPINKFHSNLMNCRYIGPKKTAGDHLPTSDCTAVRFESSRHHSRSRENGIVFR